MESTKKIGGFTTPIHKILSKDEFRENLSYAYVKNGFIYLTNGTIALKQHLSIFPISDQEAEILEGKTFHVSVLEAMWKFDQVIFTEEYIECSKDKTHAKLNYGVLKAESMPDIEGIIKRKIESESDLVSKVGFNSKYLQILSEAMIFLDASLNNHLYLEFKQPLNGGILVKTHAYDYTQQVALIMPLSNSHE